MLIWRWYFTAVLALGLLPSHHFQQSHLKFVYATSQLSAYKTISYSPWDLVMAVSWSPNGDLLAVSAGDSIYLYRSRDWNELARLEIGALTHGLDFSPDGVLLASGSRDGNIRIWDVQSIIQSSLANPLFLLDAHRKSVNSLAFSPDGKLLASGGNDAIARFWDIHSGEQLGMTIGGSFAVPSIAFSTDGSFLAIVNGDLVRLRQPDSERILGSFKADAPLYHVGVSPDGKQVAATGSDNLIRVWEVDRAYRTGQQIYPEAFILRGHTGVLGTYKALVWGSEFSPDGLKMATVGGDGMLLLWELSSGRVMSAQMAHPRGAACVDFHPNGVEIATGGLDGSVKVWR